MNKASESKFSFYYPVIIEKQLGFEGHEFPKEVFCTGHIVYSGRLMCGEAREVVKNQAKAEKEKNSPTRLPRVNTCPVCQEAWKKHPESEWYVFIHGLPVRTVGIEVVSKDVPSETKIQKETVAVVPSA